ncbi:transporter [Streptomyces sp. NPDC048527]|uniref:sodium:solute symporter family transporter n=1 Tax=Streptomyces sp. NPDC048527 TaxID=3365568 RepID=UPI00371BBD4C
MKWATVHTSDPNFVVLMVFLVLCGLLWFLTGSADDDAAMFPLPDRHGKAWQSGLAISGESLSAVTLMALVGLVSFTGFDGLVLSLGCVMGLVLLAVLIAEPLRRAGGHTIGDALAPRFAGRSVRTALGLVTLGVCLPYLVLQLTAIGTLTAFAIGYTGTATRTAAVLVNGALMISLAVSGGIRGTARVQMVKVVVLFGVLTVVAVLVLNRSGWNPDRLVGAAATRSGLGDAFLGPGVQFGSGPAAVMNRVGSFVTLALAVYCLPQVTMRVLNTPGARATRSAMRWAVTQLVVVSALLAVIGTGTVALLGAPALHAADPSGSSSLLVLASALEPGGKLMSVVFCAVFLTALSTVADVTVAAAGAVVRDLLPGSGTSEPNGRRQERLARWWAALIGVVTVTVAVQAAGWNLLVLSTFAMTLAASALGPVLFYGLLWPRFTRLGALWCLYGSGALTVLLIAVSPLISGSPAAAFPGHDFHHTPLVNPGLVTVPAGFVLGWLGSVLDRHGASVPRHAAHTTVGLIRSSSD